ncbi:hypothetical protein [Luedemannella helvata]|uniref:Uncharacterized protein n=1 Tax=Luedemannella helvata TaxID=349315 RepID=A0ABP4XBT8_9ACTN
MSGETMMGFGFKQAWLAVRDGDPAAVVAALGLRDLGPAPWRTAVDMAYLTDDRVVVTPPLPGAGGPWLLVAGRWLLLRAYRTLDLGALSTTLGTEVQLFATHRVSETHRWARAVGGFVLRDFEHAGDRGEVVVWHGEPDAAELAAGLPATLDDDLDILVSEDDVMAVAAAWSVDPTSIDGRPATASPHVAATRPLT